MKMIFYKYILLFIYLRVDIYIESWCRQQDMSWLGDICGMQAVVVGHVGMIVVL